MKRLQPTVKLTMTIREVYYAMREAGIPCNAKMISAGIESGAYPFGRVVNKGETGKKTFEIFRVDFFAWLESKIPKDAAYDDFRYSTARQKAGSASPERPLLNLYPQHGVRSVQ